MKKLLALALLLASTAQAQDFRHRYFHYDQIWTSPTSFSMTDAAGNNKITFPTTADADDVSIIFGKVTTTAPVFTLRGQTADGDDDGTIKIYPGGAAATDGARGSQIDLTGNETSGGIGIWAGNDGGQNVTIGTRRAAGQVIISPGNSIAWIFTPDLTQNATNGGNIVFQKDGTGVVDSTDAPAAAGADLAGATLMTANVVFVTGADGSKGIKLYAAPIGGARYTIYNTANAVLKVYPGEAGDQINALGAGNPVGLAAYASLDCHASSASQVWCGVQANVGAP